MTTINKFKNSTMLTLDTVSETLNVSKANVLILIKTGELPGYKLNARVYRVKQNDLDNYLESKRVQVQTL